METPMCGMCDSPLVITVVAGELYPTVWSICIMCDFSSKVETGPQVTTYTSFDHALERDTLEIGRRAAHEIAAETWLDITDARLHGDRFEFEVKGEYS